MQQKKANPQLREKNALHMATPHFLVQADHCS